MTGVYDDLVKEARERLVELEEHEEEELGDRVTLIVDEVFTGRWRSEGVMRTKDGETIDVYLVWDATGAPRFHYKSTRLVWEVEETKPQIGDTIVIVRGKDLPATSADRNPTQRFALKVRPCSDPPPGQESQAELEQSKSEGDGEDDIPF
jgi:hypothetical protein